jgi:hypothetical protein
LLLSGQIYAFSFSRLNTETRTLDRRVGSWPDAAVEPVTKCNGEIDPDQIGARIFGLIVPSNLLSTADEVIE